MAKQRHISLTRLFNAVSAYMDWLGLNGSDITEEQVAEYCKEIAKFISWFWVYNKSDTADKFNKLKEEKWKKY